MESRCGQQAGDPAAGIERGEGKAEGEERCSCSYTHDEYACE